MTTDGVELERRQRIATKLADLFWSEMVSPVGEPTELTVESSARLLLGLIANRQISWERAVRLPDDLAFRMEADEILPAILSAGVEGVERHMTVKPMLHRFNHEMARCLYSAAVKLTNEYHGDARLLFAIRPMENLYQALCELRGVSTKIAMLSLRILALDFGLTGTGVCTDDDYDNPLEFISVSPDTHVIRVFKRLGLAPANATPEQIVQEARRLSDETGHPAVSFEGGWILGLETCTALRRRCGHCPTEIAQDCPSVWRDPRKISPEAREALNKF